MRISLLVRNIADDTSPQELRDHFSKFGMIKDVYVPLDFHTRCVHVFNPAPSLDTTGPHARHGIRITTAWTGTRLWSRIGAHCSRTVSGLNCGATVLSMLLQRCCESFARSSQRQTLPEGRVILCPDCHGVGGRGRRGGRWKRIDPGEGAPSELVLCLESCRCLGARARQEQHPALVESGLVTHALCFIRMRRLAHPTQPPWKWWRASGGLTGPP